MTTVFEAIQQRRSIRKYRADPVSEEAIRLILEGARLAPSGSNTQPWRFLVVTDAEERRKLREFGFNQRWLEEAPVVIVCCADLGVYEPEMRKVRREEMSIAGILEDLKESTVIQRIDAAIAERKAPITFAPSAMMNTAIAIENMILVATSLGLGTCWMGAFESGRVREMFGLPETVITVALLSVGYPAQSPPPRPRLKLEQILLRPLSQTGSASGTEVGP